MKQLYLLLFSVALCLPAWAQLDLSGSTATVDFTGFLGTGFNNPALIGELSSEHWEIVGASDPYVLSGTNTIGDYARGLTDGTGETGGGVYSYATPTDTALWIQPTGADLTPGEIILYVTNNTGSAIIDLNVAYNVLVLNDGDRGNDFDFSYSSDLVAAFTNVPSLDLTSVAAQDGSLTTFARNTTLAGANIAAGATFRLRWTTNDVSGAGARDEFGLDDIVLTVPSTIAPVVGFAAATSLFAVEGNAGATPTTIDITMNIAPTGADVVIEVDTTFFHTARYGSDFTFVSPTSLTFPTSGTYPLTQTVTVTVLGDTEVEAPEFLELDLVVASGIAAIGTPTHKLAIGDDEIAEGLVINEFSQGATGSQEYLELLVVGTPGSTVDLRGWILDDNSGLFSYGASNQLGIADGHLRFTNHCNWAQVPAGSIILLYALDLTASPSVNPTVSATFAVDDPTDANNDYVYVIGLDYGFGGSCGTGPASVYFETDCNLPAQGAGYDDYAPASYLPPAWYSMQPRNEGDAMQVRKPDGTYFSGLSWGDKGVGASCSICDFSIDHHPDYASLGADALYFDFAGTVQRVFTFENTINNEFRSRSNWATNATADATTETPGSGNSAANTSYILSLRGAYSVVDVDASISCNLGPNQTRFFLADSPEDEIILWLQNNTATDHGLLTASTIYHPTHFQNVNLAGAPYFLRKQFRANPTVTTGADDYNIALFVSDVELADFATYLSIQLGSTFTTTDVLANLILYKIPGSTDLPATTTGTGVSQVNSPTISVMGTDRRVEANFTGGFSSFGLGVLPNVLPVEGLAFQASLLPNRQVGLEWLALSERNNDYFEILHSVDGKEFFPIGTRQGQGTAQESQQYQFVHTQPAPGLNYYQLKQVDENGQIQLSEVVSVALTLDDLRIVQDVYPNPATDALSFLLALPAAQSYRLSLLGLDGRLLATQTGGLPAGNQSLHISVETFPVGLYLYELRLNGKMYRGKWMKK